MLLLPQGDESVVVALQLLRAVDGLRVRRPQDEDGARHLALLPAAVAHLPAEHVGVVTDGADLVLIEKMYRLLKVVQLDMTSEIEVFCMMFDRSLSKAIYTHNI